jgi:hypothetical protein
MTDAAIETRDVTEQVATAISAGRSLRLIKRDFSLTETELDQVLEKLWPVSNDARIRMVKHDLGRLERIIEMLFEKSVAGNIDAAGTLIKALDRKSQLLGLDAVRQIDLQIIKPPEYKSSHERIVQAINEFWNRMTPAEKALRERLNGLNAEKALELLDRLGPEANANNGSDPTP